jgi:hypothetical protein
LILFNFISLKIDQNKRSTVGGRFQIEKGTKFKIPEEKGTEINKN